MNRIATHLLIAGLALATLVLSANPAMAQRKRLPAKIACASPAGGQQGRTVTVRLHGLYFANTQAVLISGRGITAKVIDHITPIRGKDRTALREIARKVRKELVAKAKADKKRYPSRKAIEAAFIKAAKEKKFTDKQLTAFKKLNDDRRNKKKQLNPQLRESLIISVTIAPDAPDGRRELRVKTKFGLSVPIRFFVGTHPEMFEGEPNNTAVFATKIKHPSLPVVINGVIMPGDIDYFRFAAKKGQKLLIYAQARAIVPFLADAVPGWFQAVVTLYDAKGREIRFADDYRFDPDPVIFFTVPADGEYVLSIRDSIYRGREDFVYRLTLGELPFITSIFPLGGPAGKSTRVTLAGWNLPKSKTSQVVTPANQVEWVSVRTAAGPSNGVMFQEGQFPEKTETEPNGRADEAMAITLPCTFNGKINRPGDWDTLRFDLKKGDTLTADLYARRLGSPVDSILKLSDPSGKLIARNDDHADESQGLAIHHADSALIFTAPATGRYLLRVGDTQNKGGRDYGYRLHLSLKQPAFALQITPSALNILPGQTQPLSLRAIRQGGFAGDIHVRLKDAPAGYVLSGGLIPAGVSRVQATLTVPASAAKSKTQSLRVEGFAKRKTDGVEITRPAIAADDTLQAFITHHFVAAEQWTINILPGRATPLPLVCTNPQPIKLAPGQAVIFKFKRSDKGNWPWKHYVRISDLPKGIKLKRQWLSKNKKEYNVTLAVDTTAKPGTKGNVVLRLFVTWQKKGKKGKFTGPKRQVPRGYLPAVPFQIITAPRAI